MTAPIRIRAVRGRVMDPFRGSVDEEQPERWDARAAEPAPIDAIADGIRAVPGATVSGKGRRFVVTRSDQELRVAFASAARAVSIDDAVLDGDGALAIDVLCALMPLVGAVEVRIGNYVDLIDGHEPTAAVAARYDQYWIAESLRLARELSTRGLSTHGRNTQILRTASAGRRDDARDRRSIAVAIVVTVALYVLALAGLRAF